ncbi:MAG: glycosyltransferase family 39 protein [Anaerolineae bacterium]|nr:glycosyltransferase family 39 protein [Anaerolineae bacterium]
MAALISRLFAQFRQRWLTAAVGLAVLSAVLLPANLLATQRFHHDEALYATWALQITSGADPWLVVTPVDKPPLFLYAVAGAMELLGATEAAARLPSLLATALTVGLTLWLGRRLYGAGTGILAAWLVALSPFTLLFAPTAFTDPLLVALVVAACLAAAHGRAGWAGVALGLAIATKQQGLFFIPLVLGLLAIYDLRPVPRPGVFTIYDLRSASHISGFTLYVLRFTFSILLTLLPLFIWTLTRAQAPNFLTYSLTNYGGLTTDAASFGERWWGFVELLAYGTASPLFNGIFMVGLPLLLGYGVWACRKATAECEASLWDHRPPTAENSLRCPPAPLLPCSATQADWLFTLFTLLFLLGHALFSFQIWDRYLLGLIPFLALLLARVLLWPWSLLKCSWLDARLEWQPLASLMYGLALAVLLALTLARPVQDSVNGRYPLGSHSQALQGIEQIVAYLQGHAGADHTLYHRWLGTHWRFYLWGYPYDLQYWASPGELAAKAKPGHLIAFPSWQSDTEARLALAGEGLALKELTRAYHPAGYPSMVLYEIVRSETVVSSQ